MTGPYTQQQNSPSLTLPPSLRRNVLMSLMIHLTNQHCHNHTLRKQIKIIQSNKVMENPLLKTTMKNPSQYCGGESINQITSETTLSIVNFIIK